MTAARVMSASCLLALLGPLGVGACSSGGDEGASDACASEPIAVEKEMMVVDDAIINDERAKNARADGSAGPWSFRHLIEELVPQGTPTTEFVRTWLTDWVTIKQLNGFAVDQPNEDRAANMNRLLMCPWLKRTPANACNADCSACGSYELDMKTAPFRLLAIVNRLDLRREVASEPNGESRLVFGLMDGPADDPASRPLAMTIIFEYALSVTKSTKEWADDWHALGKYPSYDDSYKAALEKVTDSFVARGSTPAGRNGSSLAQLRSNESVFNWVWQLREFGLGTDGLLRMRGVRNTPGRELDNSSALRDFVKANADAIRNNRFELPAAMRGASADAVPQPYVWNLSGVDPETARAFTANTCNGCHTDGTAVETAFHVTPFRTGAARLSRFIKDPAGGPDDMTLRIANMRDGLCGK